MLKVSVQFPECSGQRFRNIPHDSNPEYLSECRYNLNNDTVCPMFRIGDIVNWTGNNFSDVALTVTHSNAILKQKYERKKVIAILLGRAFPN